jgi:hypothetical protein
MTDLVEKMKELRFDRMRLGSAVMELADVPSMPELRVALVPITEADYDRSLEMASVITAPENQAGWLRRDRRANVETLLAACRDPNNIEERVFKNVDEIRELLEVSDINYLTDRYLEMTAQSSPSLDMFSPEDMEAAKKVLQEIDWNELSGAAWYRLRRFLSELGPTVPLDRWRGFSSTPSSTTTNDDQEST